MMKTIIRILLITAILALTSSDVSADSPYTTWAQGPGGYLTMTQDAYSPISEVELPISGAEELFITPDGTFYIADTGKGRIVKLENFEITATFGEDVLEGPTGLFVDQDGTMYVADAKLNEVFIFDAAGNLLKRFGRPTEPLFGKTREFLPRKIAVDARKNLYVISEGSVDGVVQLNTNGNFIGYFGANTASMSFKDDYAAFVLNERTTRPVCEERGSISFQHCD